MHKNMREMEQYSDSQFVVKSVYKGDQSEAVLLFLKPGQELPPHPHERFEVVLVPYKGTGVMIVDGSKEVSLVPETLYYEPAGRTFRIVNTGDSPLQILITLIRVEDAASRGQVPSPAEAEESFLTSNTTDDS
jgi:mannose-6-phosphate isomerase-like protein (cupin superfamily)